MPVVVRRGAAGGFELLDGWRTTLTGMTPHESQALFLSGLPGPVEELGLGETMASAQLKLLAALPREWQEAAHRVSSRFHVDLTGWYRRTRPVANLRALADAVFADHRVTVEYESWEGVVTRELEPLGLVVKAGAWYLAAQLRGGRSGKPAGARTYRVTSIRALRVGDGFTRPKDFDLPAYWLESTRRFERDIYRDAAEVRLSERGRRHLCGASTAVEEAIEKAVAAGGVGKDGWLRVTVPIESIAHATGQMLALGTDVEVLAPAELRESVRAVAAKVASVHRPGRGVDGAGTGRNRKGRGGKKASQ